MIAGRKTSLKQAGRAIVAPRNPTRAVWLDVARGLGVILVVLGHMLLGLVKAHRFPTGPVEAWINYTLYTFHMPLFFYLSALNVQTSLRRGTVAFLRARSRTIVYPYVLWSLIQGGIIMMLGGDANMPVRPADLLAIWYHPVAQFWFLYALMLCHVLAALIPVRRLLVIVAGLGLVIFTFLPARPALSLTLHDLPFYVAGLYGGRSVVMVPTRSVAWLLAVSCGFAAAVVLGGAWSAMDPLSPVSFPACILGVALVVLLCQALPPRHVGGLAAVGAMSMTIYILHLLTGAGARIAMQRLDLPLGPWIGLSVCTAAGVFIPMLAHVALKRGHMLGLLGLDGSWPRLRTPSLQH